MITDKWLRVIAWSAGLVAAAALLYVIRSLYEPLLRPILDVLLPFSIAIALALMLDPAIGWMNRRGLSRGAAIGLVAFIFLSAVAVIGVFLVPVLFNQTIDFKDNVPKYYEQSKTFFSDFLSSHQSLLRRFQLPTRIQDIGAEISTQAPNIAAKSFETIGAFLLGLLSKSVWLVLIPIITVFLLADIDRLKPRSLLIVPEQHRERIAELLSSVGRVFGAYVRGLLVVAALYGIACGVALALWGVPYAVLLGAVAGALSLVPYIGTISTLLLVAMVTVVSESSMPHGHPINALWVALTILAINLAFDNGLSPKLVGKAVGIHPALAIFALLVGGGMFGLIGMILSVPVAASIQILVLELCPSLRTSEPEPEAPEKPSILVRLRGYFKKERPGER
jgi:predicted PurR-regulated permease PerM